MPQPIFSSPHRTVSIPAVIDKFHQKLQDGNVEKTSENRTVSIPAVIVKLHQKLQDGKLTCLLQTKTLYYGL